jgi:hypothetical protein
MYTTTITTIIKMIESLPAPDQEKIVERLREYVIELQDEADWDQLFYNTQTGLVKAAKLARRQISDGLSEPLDEDRL